MSTVDIISAREVNCFVTETETVSIVVESSLEDLKFASPLRPHTSYGVPHLNAGGSCTLNAVAPDPVEARNTAIRRA